MRSSMATVYMLILVFLPLGVHARRSSDVAQALDLSTPGESSGAFDVHLLVTRHGLSCTNIVEKWVHKFDAGRRLIHDPLLGGAGVHGCNEAREVVERYREDNSLPPFDAVLSSVLVRAMETALLTYPQAPESPLYVVPYIREYASGQSNAPKDHAAQVADLNTTVPHAFEVDYRWVDKFGSEKGSWDQFLYFLEQSFLPDLISRLEKPPGSQIVLPVVTHSKFMRDSDVGAKCKDAFESNPSGKPLNNQVVDMAYTFHLGKPAIAESGEAASTVEFTIEECGEPRAVGHWKRTGMREGRPTYANVEDSQVVIWWYEEAGAWQLLTTAAWGYSITVLYESRQADSIVPSRGWAPQNGKEPQPTFSFRKDQYALKETSTPCKDVYHGLSLKDGSGKLRSPICLKDVGESCIGPIAKFSWAPGVLWKQTYEAMIAKSNKTITNLKAELADKEERIAEIQQKMELVDDHDKRVRLGIGIDMIRKAAKGVAKSISEHQERRAEISRAACWTGGNPDSSRGDLGENNWAIF